MKFMMIAAAALCLGFAGCNKEETAPAEPPKAAEKAATDASKAATDAAKAATDAAKAAKDAAKKAVPNK